jgi:hypothetical protein
MAQHPPLNRYVPLLAWLPRYRRTWLRIDVLAGITAWGTTVPTAMGFAQMAGLPAQAGLYAAMVALLAYAVLGTSKVLKVETSPSMAVMSAAVVAPLALGDFAYYVTLSAALALVVLGQTGRDRFSFWAGPARHHQPATKSVRAPIGQRGRVEPARAVDHVAG